VEPCRFLSHAVLRSGRRGNCPLIRRADEVPIHTRCLAVVVITASCAWNVPCLSRQTSFHQIGPCDEDIELRRGERSIAVQVVRPATSIRRSRTMKHRKNERGFPCWPIREFRERSDGIANSGRQDTLFRRAQAFSGRTVRTVCRIPRIWKFSEARNVRRHCGLSCASKASGSASKIVGAGRALRHAVQPSARAGSVSLKYKAVRGTVGFVGSKA